ncbi:MAG: hypothetical protein AAFQ78_02745, partial [Bacteroidota bacterium]
VFFYAYELFSGKYKLPNGKAFERIVNTVRPDNPGSLVPNIKSGLKPYRESEKYGKRRLHLGINMSEIKKAREGADSESREVN